VVGGRARGVFKPGNHGSTFGGNQLAMCGMVTTLDTMKDEGLLENAAERGAQLLAGLQALQARDERIGDVRGRGLMLGVELVADRSTRTPDGPLADALIAACADDGLLVLTCGPDHNVVRWLAPLNVTAAEIDEGLRIFATALDRSRPVGDSRP